MAETICGPGDGRYDSELFLQKVMTDGVLVDNIIDITDSLVIFDPTAINNL
jgi:hypothetical protein